MKYEINNFCGGPTATVKTAEVKGIGPLVYITQCIGSLSFQHSMTPEQAREMAAALIACADQQDAAINADFAAHREQLEVVAA